MPKPVVKLSSECHAELDAFLVDRIYEFNAAATRATSPICGSTKIIAARDLDVH